MITVHKLTKILLKLSKQIAMEKNKNATIPLPENTGIIREKLVEWSVFFTTLVLSVSVGFFGAFGLNKIFEILSNE